MNRRTYMAASLPDCICTILRHLRSSDYSARYFRASFLTAAFMPFLYFLSSLLLIRLVAN